MFGVTGRLARVDLGSGTVAIEAIPNSTFTRLLGGNGLAADIILRGVPPGVDPLSPENILVFATGPLVGTGIQGTDRLCIAAKSPLTGLFFDSYLGGRFASTLKQAGFDALAVVGKADAPKYIVLSDGGVEIRGAEGLVGKSPKEAMLDLTAEMKDVEVCSIGAAGENLVRYACIVHPRRTARSGVAGRGGLGAVMGAKNLKAVVAQRGQKDKLKVYSSGGLKELKPQIQVNLDEKTKHLQTMGTAFGVGLINSLGALVSMNATEETFADAESISGERLRNQYYRRNISCHSCPVACGKLMELDGELVKNPEYEAIYALGTMVGLGDIETIARANELCDEYGLDAISVGVTIAFAIECFQKGLLSAEECQGYDLRYGDGRLILSLIEATARRRGIGNLLAEGSRRMSQAVGKDSWKYAYHVKGLELAGHSARAHKVLSIGYATGTRGGTHQDRRPRYGPGMRSYEGKVEQAVASQNQTAVGDSLVQCRLVMEAGLGIGFNENYTNLLAAVTGWGPDATELNVIGERICNMERLFNVREGISRKDDTLPYRAMWEAVPPGATPGELTPPETLEAMLNSFYTLRGWDQNGIPTKETLARLGLEGY